jgi:hypothetical protein
MGTPKILNFAWLLRVIVILAAATTSYSQPIASDDFSSGTLDIGIWTFVNPLSDCNFSLTSSSLLIELPQGVSHDVWRLGNKAARIMQSADNTDFEIEAKFDSELELKYQMQGFLVEQDAGNFLRLEVHTDGTNVHIFAASFLNGSPRARINEVIAKGAPYYLSVRREADLWTFSYSYDGIHWVVATSFTYPLTVNSVGFNR